MNQVHLIGNITKDLELKKTQSNKSVVEFTIAVNKYTSNGQKTNFPQIQVWGNAADNLVRYCSKGSKVAVTGELVTDSYDGKNGKVYRTYVLASNVEFLSSKHTTDNEPVQKEEFSSSVSSVSIEPDDLPFF